jgi:hypothetical protein
MSCQTRHSKAFVNVSVELRYYGYDVMGTTPFGAQRFATSVVWQTDSSSRSRPQCVPSPWAWAPPRCRPTIWRGLEAYPSSAPVIDGTAIVGILMREASPRRAVSLGALYEAEEQRERQLVTATSSPAGATRRLLPSSMSTVRSTWESVAVRVLGWGWWRSLRTCCLCTWGSRWRC